MLSARRKDKNRLIVPLETKTRAMLDRTDTMRRLKKELGQPVPPYPMEKTIELTDDAYNLLKQTALARATTISHCANLLIQQAITDAGSELISFH